MNNWRTYWTDLDVYRACRFKTVEDFINGKEYNMKTQKISRKDLQTIYGQVCPDWQKKITELALWQSGDTIEVEDSLVSKAFGDADVKQRDMLKKYFKYTSGNILDEIESFDDIVRIAKEKYNRVFHPIDFKNGALAGLSTKEIDNANADRKLNLIDLVLNDGWKPDFTNSNQYKWSPWFKRESGGWVAYGVARCFFYYAYAGVGFYKDEKTAVFAGQKFLDIFKEKLPA